MRLLFVINDAGYFLSHRLGLARAAAAAGYEVHVAIPPGGDDAAIAGYGFTPHHVNISRRGMNPLELLRSVRRVSSICDAIRPDIVHALPLKAILCAGLATRRKGGKLVATFPGLGHIFASGGGWMRSTVRRGVCFLLRYALNDPSRRAIFQNHDDMEIILSRRIIGKGQSVFIPGSGVDMAAFSVVDEPAGVPVVLLPARMLWEKGVGQFVEAADLIKRRGVNARFVLAGGVDDGNPSAIKRDQLEQWNAAGLVEWLGHRTDMADLIKNSHIVCLPSYYREGLPKSLLEAMACGRAIVTTDAPGCREAVVGGVTGLLVPTKNTAALADALAKLIEDPATRRKMGMAGRERAEELYDEKVIIRQTMAVYDELLGGKQP